MNVREFDTVRSIIKPMVFFLCLLPLGLLVFNYFTDNLSANPLSDITNTTGTWTLRFLVITLSITPLRKVMGWSSLQRFRRMLGLFAFFYVSLHFTTYLYLDKFFDWSEIIKDVAKRPFITVGFAAFTMLIPLAATSPDFMAKWIGGKRWRNLHKLVYVCAFLGVIHYLWLVKADTEKPLIYGAVVFALVGFRLCVFIARRISQSRRLRTQPAANTDPKILQTLTNGS